MDEGPPGCSLGPLVVAGSQVILEGEPGSRAEFDDHGVLVRTAEADVFTPWSDIFALKVTAPERGPVTGRLLSWLNMLMTPSSPIGPSVGLDIHRKSGSMLGFDLGIPRTGGYANSEIWALDHMLGALDEGLALSALGAPEKVRRIITLVRDHGFVLGRPTRAREAVKAFLCTT